MSSDIEVIFIEDVTQVIEIPAAQGIQGPQGPPCETGGDTGRVTMLAIAGSGTGISAHRAVYSHNGSVWYADPNSPDTACETVGVTTHAALLGEQIQIMTAGPLEDVSFSFDVTKPIFIGPEGRLVQEIDMSWKYIRVIGYPTGTTSMFVCLQEIMIIN